MAGVMSQMTSVTAVEAYGSRRLKQDDSDGCGGINIGATLKAYETREISSLKL